MPRAQSDEEAVGGSLDSFHTSRRQKVLNPCNATSAGSASGEERSLFGAGKCDKESVHFFVVMRLETPPSLAIKAVEIVVWNSTLLLL